MQGLDCDIPIFEAIIYHIPTKANDLIMHWNHLENMICSWLRLNTNYKKYKNRFAFEDFNLCIYHKDDEVCCYLNKDDGKFLISFSLLSISGYCWLQMEDCLCGKKTRETLSWMNCSLQIESKLMYMVRMINLKKISFNYIRHEPDFQYIPPNIFNSPITKTFPHIQEECLNLSFQSPFWKNPLSYNGKMTFVVDLIFIIIQDMNK